MKLIDLLKVLSTTFYAEISYTTGDNCEIFKTVFDGSLGDIKAGIHPELTPELMEIAESTVTYVYEIPSESHYFAKIRICCLKDV